MKRQSLAVALALFASCSSYAAEPACPDAASKILRAYGIADAVSRPHATTDLSEKRYPTGWTVQDYKNSQKGIEIEVSVREQDEAGSFISIRLGHPLSPAHVGESSSDAKSKYIELVYHNDCQLTGVMAKEAIAGIWDQASTSAKFCVNLNSGKPTRKFSSRFGEYIEFTDGSGNIDSKHEALTRKMCKEIEPFLVNVYETFIVEPYSASGKTGLRD